MFLQLYFAVFLTLPLTTFIFKVFKSFFRFPEFTFLSGQKKSLIPTPNLKVSLALQRRSSTQYHLVMDASAQPSPGWRAVLTFGFGSCCPSCRGRCDSRKQWSLCCPHSGSRGQCVTAGPSGRDLRQGKPSHLFSSIPSVSLIFT